MDGVSTVCRPLPGRAVCHPLPIFGPASARCPLCAGFTVASEVPGRAEAADLERAVFGEERAA